MNAHIKWTIETWGKKSARQEKRKPNEKHTSLQVYTFLGGYHLIKIDYLEGMCCRIHLVLFYLYTWHTPLSPKPFGGDKLLEISVG